MSGVPHPPGYPTWVFLASGLVHLVPWGSPAWRASLLSALGSCGAAAIAYLAMRGLGCRRNVAGALALSLGLLPSVWRLSTAAEVYTLNLFFVAAIAGCLVAAREAARRGPTTASVWRGRTPGRRAAPAIPTPWAPGSGWILGAIGALAIGLGNHPTVLTLGPSIVLVAFAVERRMLLRPRFLLVAATLLALGAAQYGLLVARTFDPDTSYLGVDAGTAERFWEVVARNRHSLLHFSPAELLTRRLPLVLGTLARETWPLLPFAAAGGFLLRGSMPHRGIFLPRSGISPPHRGTTSPGPASRAPGPSLALALLSALATDLGLIAAYDIGDAEGYYLPASLVLVLLAGKGVERAFAWLDRPRAGLVAWALPAALAITHFDHADRSRERSGAQAALAMLPRPALLVSLDYDASQAFLYEVEMERRAGATASHGARQPVAGGELRARHLPPAALDLAFGLDDVRRYVAGEAALRWPPAGRLARPGPPLYLYAPRPEWRAKAERAGLTTAAAGEGLLRLTSSRPSGATSAPLPLALLVGRLERVPLLPQAIARLAAPDFDARSSVLRIGNGAPIGEPGAAGEARLLTWDDTVVEVEVEAARDGWLLLTDTFTSRWVATVDGLAAPFLELDLLYWGVPVTAGRHRIKIRFLPHPFELRRWLLGPG